MQTARDLVESNHTRPLTSGDPIIQRSCGLEPHTAAAEAGTWLVFGFFLLFFEPPDARHREGKMRMTTQAAVQWPRRTIYHGRLSRSEFHEGQVPLKASGSCSWCWYSSRHIQRVVNIFLHNRQFHVSNSKVACRQPSQPIPGSISLAQLLSSHCHGRLEPPTAAGSSRPRGDAYVGAS